VVIVTQLPLGATTASTCPLRTSGSKMSTKRRASTARFVPIAGVEGGLAAAGLLRRKDDLDALPLQQFHGRHPTSG
jgi:hypothetical protein